MSSKNFQNRTVEKQYKDGDVIFKENDTSKELYFVVEGEVTIMKSVHGEVQVLGNLGKGEFFGEMSTFTGEQRVATAMSKGSSRLVVVKPDSFQSLIQGQPEFGLKVVATLCKRLKEADKQIEDLMVKNQTDTVISIIFNEASEGSGQEITKSDFTYSYIFGCLEKRTHFRRDIIIKLLDKIAKEQIIHIEKDDRVVNIKVTENIFNYVKKRA